MSRWRHLLSTLVLFTVSCATVRRAEAQPPPPQPATNNTVYHCFVRSFRDGNGDGIGDLRGIIDKLDYLNDGQPGAGQDLEIGILWLMPIFPTKTYHGYDVTDYRGVNAEYGTMADLEALLKAAHGRGMRVVLDVPFNHTSNEHPWFKDALADRDGRGGWYHIYPDDPGARNGWHRADDAAGNRVRYFGFAYNMPDLNFDNAKVREEVIDVAKFWLNRGVDGFRLDAAKHVFAWSDNPNEGEIRANNGWWRDFGKAVQAAKPGAVIVGEVLGSEYQLRRHAWGLDALVDEPLMEEIRRYVAAPHDGMVRKWKTFVERAEGENPDAPYASWVYVASHDKNPRLSSALRQQMPGSHEARYRVAVYLLMSLGKYAVIYNGDELMQQGWKWNGNPHTADNPGDGSFIWDETLREPLPWYAANAGTGQTRWQPGNHTNFLPKFDGVNDGISVEEQEKDASSSVLGLVRALGRLRARLPEFANGELGDVLTDTGEWLVFERVSGQKRFIVLINPTGQARNYEFHDGWYPAYRDARVVFWSDGQARRWNEERQQNGIGGRALVGAYGMVVLERP